MQDLDNPSYSSAPPRSIYAPAPVATTTPARIGTTTPSVSPSLFSRVAGGQMANIDKQIGFNDVMSANSEADYQNNKQYLNDQQVFLMKQLGLKDEEIAVQRGTLNRQYGYQDQQHNLSLAELLNREGAYNRQMQGLSGQRTLEQQLWGLERQELGSEKEQDIYAAMRARQAAESEAVVRGALESVGYGRNLEDVAKELAWQLADIDRRFSAQGIKEQRYDLNYNEQRAQLEDAITQGKIDRHRLGLDYTEGKAKLDDEGKMLDILARQNGISKEEAERNLQYALDKLGISKAVTITDLAAARSDLDAGRFNVLQQLFGDISAVGGLNLAPSSPSGTYSDVGGYQVDSNYAPNFSYIQSNFGLQPTSGYRDPAHNASIPGASPTSYHLSGRAMDYVGDYNQMIAGRDWALANGAQEAYVDDSGTGMHLHVAW